MSFSYGFSPVRLLTNVNGYLLVHSCGFSPVCERFRVALTNVKGFLLVLRMFPCTCGQCLNFSCCVFHFVVSFPVRTLFLYVSTLLLCLSSLA